MIVVVVVVVAAAVVVVVVVMMMTTTTTTTMMMMMYLCSSYVPSRYRNGLKFFIFTLHVIEPHEASTIKLQVRHCSD